MVDMRASRLVPGALGAGLLLLALVRLAASAVGEPVSSFTRDTIAVAGVPWYTGSVSLITNMVWAAATALAVFVGWAAPRARRQMLALGGFTLVLTVDDAMLIHDRIGPGHGVPEKVFPAVYGVLALLLLWEMLRASTRPVALTFVLGGALLAVSVAFDVVFHDLSFLVEDGSKLLGALVWTTVPVLTYAAQRPSSGVGGAALSPDTVRASR
jgi:hypothetical protein